MTIEMVGGRVTVQGKKVKADASGEAPTKKKGKPKAAPEAPESATDTTTGTPPDDAAPSRRGKKPVPDVPASLNVVTPGQDAALPAEPPEPTLADLAAGYLSHLEASGKSEGTVFSYGVSRNLFRLDVVRPPARPALGKPSVLSSRRAHGGPAF